MSLREPALRLKPAGRPPITLGKVPSQPAAQVLPLPLPLPPRHGPCCAPSTCGALPPRDALRQDAGAGLRGAWLRFLLKRPCFGRALPRYVIKSSLCRRQSACWLRVSSNRSRAAFLRGPSTSPLAVSIPLAKVLALVSRPAQGPAQHLVHRGYSLLHGQ